MAKTYKKRYNFKNKSNKKFSFSGTIKNFNREITIKFLEMLLAIKLYHWKTNSYATHKATDELYERLSEKIDRFLEVLMGKDETRINLMESKIKLLDPDSTKLFKDQIFKYREFLEDIDIYFDRHDDSDLLSIRDDILADLNQFLYLLSMNK
jgi:DNA-binding ferritin-like protein